MIYISIMVSMFGCLVYCALFLQLDLLMEAETQPSALKRATAKLIDKITAPQQFQSCKQALLALPSDEQKEMIDELQKQTESLPYVGSPEQSTLPPSKHEQQKQLQHQQEQHHESKQLAELIPQVEEVQLSQEQPLSSRKDQPKKQPLTEPPLIAPKRNQTEQSSQKSRPNQSRKGVRRSSEEQSVNLQLTQKTKRSKNMSITNKVDSLLYSDATLLYSNDTNGFDREASGPLPLRSESQKVVLKQVQDEEQEDISAHMERAQSRQCDRIPTESKASEREQGLRIQTQKEDGSVFQTQINEYKGKISKIRELKESKKRKLEAELRRINQQLEEMTKREQEATAAPKVNKFESRVKISDNIEAKVKAERFVRDLHLDKRSRQEMHLGQLHAIDKNINDYMQQLMQDRYKNEERIKQRKKLEIIDRMKQQEMRKIEEQQRKDKNLQFVHQFRTSNSRPDLQQQQQKKSSDYQAPRKQVVPQPRNKERSPTKKSEPSFEQQTPQLSRKKAYFKKIRNLSFKKQKLDAYEQVLN